MKQIVRDSSQLPSWFAIEPYTQWQDKNPHEAALAVDDRFFFARFAQAMMHEEREITLSDETIETALSELAKGAVKPFNRFAMEPMIEIFRSEKRRRLSEEEYAEWEEYDRADQDLSEQSSQAAKAILGDGFYLGLGEDVSLVTLWDALEFMKRHEELIKRLEESAQSLAETNGWDFAEVRDSMFMHVPIYGDDGSSYVIVEGHPTIDAETQAIRRYLMKNYRDEGSYPIERPSEVKKLFEYRAAAYADLQTWACLTRSTITAKCLANALFPDGRFGELDMRPSRTIGGFYKRLEAEPGYLDNLVGKAAEITTLQF